MFETEFSFDLCDERNDSKRGVLWEEEPFRFERGLNWSKKVEVLMGSVVSMGIFDAHHDDPSASYRLLDVMKPVAVSLVASPPGEEEVQDENLAP